MRKVWLEEAEELQEVRKKEEIINADNLEPTSAQEPLGARRSNGGCVFVKRTPRHDVTRARIPGIVLPKGKQPVGAEAAVNVIQRRSSFRNWNVMEDAVAVDKVYICLWKVVVKREKLTTAGRMLKPGTLERAGRNIEPDCQPQVK